MEENKTTFQSVDEFISSEKNIAAPVFNGKRGSPVNIGKNKRKHVKGEPQK
jgi:CTP:molybdopterin cytidylyltransferase MocA